MSATRFFDAALTEGQPPIRVYDQDPDLFAGLDPRTAQSARRHAVAPAVRLEAGPWSGEAEGCDPDTSLGLLVVDGLLLRTLELRRQRRSELLGPGDLIRPWQHDDEESLSVLSTHWDVLEPTRVAVLDARFLTLSCRWPSVVSALMARAVRRSRCLALQLAIADLRRVEERLMLLFWHLADRWGRVGPEGVLVPVRMTHDVLAQLVGAQRPTVTGALQALTRRGLVRRRPDRTWLLTPGSLEDLLERPAAEPALLPQA